MLRKDPLLLKQLQRMRNLPRTRPRRIPGGGGMRNEKNSSRYRLPISRLKRIKSSLIR
jgi:hypothetical protein